MKCPICGRKSMVLATRGNVRQRECTQGHRFSTEERIIEGRTHGGVRPGAGAKPKDQQGVQAC